MVASAGCLPLRLGRFVKFSFTASLCATLLRGAPVATLSPSAVALGSLSPMSQLSLWIALAVGSAPASLASWLSQPPPFYASARTATSPTTLPVMSVPALRLLPPVMAVFPPCARTLQLASASPSARTARAVFPPSHQHLYAHLLQYCALKSCSSGTILLKPIYCRQSYFSSIVQLSPH